MNTGYARVDQSIKDTCHLAIAAFFVGSLIVTIVITFLNYVNQHQQINGYKMVLCVLGGGFSFSLLVFYDYARMHFKTIEYHEVNFSINDWQSLYMNAFIAAHIVGIIAAVCAVRYLTLC